MRIRIAAPINTWPRVKKAIGTDERGSEVLRGFLCLGGAVIPFDDYSPGPCHATDSVESLAGLLILATHDTDQEEEGSFLACELDTGPEDCGDCGYMVCADIHSDLWLRYYVSPEGPVAPWAVVWGGRLIHDGLATEDEARELCDHL